MQDTAGTFFVIEGTDGSGKGTQLSLLAERLKHAGYAVETFDFPQYDVPSSYFVKQYLNGEYGDAEDVGPYTASLFYALDRYEAAPKIRAALAQGKIVLANRYVGSNMAHQGTKFYNPEERRGYFIWLDNLEFEMLHIPRPTMSFVLRVPAQIAQEMVDKKEPREYTDKKRDLHEADLDHLLKSVEVYDDLTQLFPKDFQRVDCVRDEQLLPIEAVQDLIWQKINPMLPEPPLALPVSQASVEATAPFTTEEVVEPRVEESPVRQSPAQQQETEAVEAARITGAAEPAAEAHIQPTYYMPASLSPEIATQYDAYMARMSGIYDALVRELVSHLTENTATSKEAQDDAWQQTIHAQATEAARAVLPVATTLTAQTAPGSHTQHTAIAAFAAANMPGNLAPENANVVLTDIAPRNEFELVADMLYEHSNLPLSQLRAQILQWPYDKKLEAFEAYTANDTAEDTTHPQPSGKALAKARYSWDLTTDYDTFATMQQLQHGGELLGGENQGNGLERQPLTPRYGYRVPKLVEDAGLVDEFEACFDLSLRQYSYLQSAGAAHEAQYVTLLGHNVRWKVTYDALEMNQLKSVVAKATETELPTGCRDLIQAMQEKQAEKHPLLADAPHISA